MGKNCADKYANSAVFLAPDKGILNRMTGLTPEGFAGAKQHFLKNWKYETYPDFIGSKRLSDEVTSRIPICTDALPIWKAFQNFFTDYVKLFYLDDNAEDLDVEDLDENGEQKRNKVKHDEQLGKFWECVNNRGHDFEL